GVVGEAVDTDNRGQSAFNGDIFNVLFEVCDAFFYRIQVLARQAGIEGTAGDDPEAAGMGLDRPNGGNDNGGGGPEPGMAALDVDHLLEAKVAAEAAFRDDEFGQAEADLVREDGRVAVGNVPKGTRMNENGGVLESLKQVGLDR